MRLSRTGRLIISSFAILAAAGCGGDGKKAKLAYVERPVEELYRLATEALERNRFDRAIPLFEEVERQHPYSAWARRAMLMKSFSYYRQNDYDEAIAGLDQFISLHPGNRDAPYAYYLKAMCFYEQIRDVGRDQDFTDKAVVALTNVVRRYPDTEYALDARLKLDLTLDHLAGKEMYVGRFYLRAGKHIAAINRFKTVVDDYQTTSHAPEAMHRLVEAYLGLGVYDEARHVANFLGYNYPGSEWYKYTYDLLADAGILEQGTTPPTAALRKVKEKKKDEEERLDRGVDIDGVARPPSGAEDIGTNSPIRRDETLPQ